MKLRTAVTLLFTAVSAQLSASPLDESKIQFLGPIAGESTIKPADTAHRDAIIENLLPSLQQDAKQVTLFNNESKWQALNKVSQLTIPGLQALKFNFTTERFVSGKLKLEGIEKAKIFLNGEPVSGVKEVQLDVVKGDHQILVIAEQVNDWKKVDLSFEGEAAHDAITLTEKQTKALSAKQLFDAPTVSAISLAPNGEYYISTIRHYDDEKGNSAITETALYNEDGDMLYSFDGMSANSFAWRDDSSKLTYLKDNKAYVLDVKTFKRTQVATKLNGANSIEFFDNETLIFAWTNSGKEEGKLTKHYQGLEDRWSYARTQSQIFLLDIKSGLLNPVTVGAQSHNLADFDAQANTVLATRNKQDYAQPPHMLTELIEIDLSNNQQRVIGQYRTFSGAQYTKNGIYVTAGPDFAEGAGRNLPEGMLANNYDGQLYWLDRKGNNVKALSKNFDPAIGSFTVLSNGDVVLKATDQDRQQLFLFDESKSTFKRLNTGLDVVANYSVSSERNPEILFTGTTASTPQQLKTMSTSDKRADTLWDSTNIAYQNAEIANLEEFNFTNTEGVEIKGRVYLPHDLDKAKKYPALVYYYGGTSPVTRGFTGRYPFNLWAAKGYVVYVLQPTGATGFGQKFSAEHVNAWGEYTANDIIMGTKEFVKAYPFVDDKRLGNLGASYGGFMTMLLTTKTDLFSASISHAGISNITSYWGQGWWGYLYSGEASKGSYPWNNPTLYSQHSPVFNADKVTTPLLLIHGDADTNVPPGESHNMYTALKILGQDVELVEYKGADHQIFARDKRFHWWNTMLAYFDKHLKQEPQWWEHLYGK
ncbi:prolyl oligopeptidase family serine peptidase [Pseudoalteromonas piscicida]|uniref:alpha/beta hydrolase family protein n=1 Tax=Pseudoalteromonas piscicida TaxID=43662 RepID=UPI001EFEED15|nr:prolyl oligopeptidase family serine peptidase [Pseudoalteromonas piscicida]MCG9768578.1 prolyl oligopeptidase family serine peptidase [Pseudoalteromonas piscicida]